MKVTNKSMTQNKRVKTDSKSKIYVPIDQSTQSTQ
jgi:hypothetical protein